MNTQRKADGSYPRGTDFGVTAHTEIVNVLKSIFSEAVENMQKKIVLRSDFKILQSNLSWELWMNGNQIACVEASIDNGNPMVRSSCDEWLTRKTD